MRNPSKNTLKTLLRVNNGSPTPGWAMRKADYFLFNEVGARIYIMSKGKICNRQPKGYERYLTPNCKTIYQNSKLVMYLSLEFIEPKHRRGAGINGKLRDVLKQDAYDKFVSLAEKRGFDLTKLTHLATKRIAANELKPLDYHNLTNVAPYIIVKLVTDNGYTIRAVGGHWQLQVDNDVWFNFFDLEVANNYIVHGAANPRLFEGHFVDSPKTISQARYANKEQIKYDNAPDNAGFFYISLEHDSRQMRTSMHTILKDLQTLKDEA